MLSYTIVIVNCVTNLGTKYKFLMVLSRACEALRATHWDVAVQRTRCSLLTRLRRELSE
jgi:hypothetical protein